MYVGFEKHLPSSTKRKPHFDILYYNTSFSCISPNVERTSGNKDFISASQSQEHPSPQTCAWDRILPALDPCSLRGSTLVCAEERLRFRYSHDSH